MVHIDTHPSDPSTLPYPLSLTNAVYSEGGGKSRRVLEGGGGGEAAERERAEARGGGKGEAVSGVSPDYNQPDTEALKTGAWRTEIKGHKLSFCVS